MNRARRPPASSAVAKNVRYWCSVTGCEKHRHKLSPYCVTHWSTYVRLGHPTESAIRPKLWHPYRAPIQDLFQSNPGHAGLVQALAYLTGWMQQATSLDGQGEHWASEIARLGRVGVQPVDLLVELCAIWSYLQDNPRAVRSDRGRTFAVARAVLALAPRPRRQPLRPGANGSQIVAKPAALEHVGKHLMVTYAPLLVNVHQSISTQADQAQAVLDAMRAPFSPTPKAVIQAASATTQPTTN